jgi:hypothetical protein
MSMETGAEFGAGVRLLRVSRAAQPLPATP